MKINNITEDFFIKLEKIEKQEKQEKLFNTSPSENDGLDTVSFKNTVATEMLENGNQIHTSYDEYGNIINQQIQKAENTVHEKLEDGTEIFASYDKDGNMISFRCVSPPPKEPIDFAQMSQEELLEYFVKDSEEIDKYFTQYENKFKQEQDTKETQKNPIPAAKEWFDGISEATKQKYNYELINSKQIKSKFNNKEMLMTFDRENNLQYIETMSNGNYQLSAGEYGKNQQEAIDRIVALLEKNADGEVHVKGNKIFVVNEKEGMIQYYSVDENGFMGGASIIVFN